MLVDQIKIKEYSDEYLERHQKPKYYIIKPMGDSWFYSHAIKCLYYEKENGRKKRLNEAFSSSLGGVGVSKHPQGRRRERPVKIKAEISELENRNTEINKCVQEPVLFLNKVE